MSNKVIINEVGLRDGLQNQPRHVPVEGKLEILGALIAAGVRSVEATSFVSPKAVPQMADAGELYGRLPLDQGVNYQALVPNEKGYERAVASGAKTIALVLASTEEMNVKNIGMSLERAIEVNIGVIKRAKREGIIPRSYISTAVGCPYEGDVAPEVVFDLTAQMFEAGAAEVAVADTIGSGNPAQVKFIFETLANRYGPERLAAHFHDTRGLALANTWAALECGVRTFDTSIGGLGGCPFAPGATGNVATEDVVHMVERSGFETGIDVEGLRKAVKIAADFTGQELGGRVLSWIESQERRKQATASAAAE
ncbi:MAG: hydroxymethylglutaryl-CoA lyase [Rhodospirillaceae bacterium]|jgi:hydroxymethylglutaryl-CoA lyase|nr:hydroxymethylglutaryl-CoA lyase [Rhodospirillaceae bacterium]MBT5038323.1 hydroxymethylglutaryl-CoA lyase [Rhodospirillaceae bacterium]MBT6827940.1 hydroxymethylglutaryl-CoA lyase [Rhodospirillaceae bacterium]